MPALSVIVPIYNIEAYLPKCIDSILDQTFTDFELILVNDGSTDRSKEICKHYEAKDRRVVLLNKDNGGVSDARNRGLEYASSKYVAFVDGDDWLDKNMLQVLIQLCEEKDADLSICLINTGKTATEMKQSGSNVHVYSKRAAIKALYEEPFIGFSICNKLFKKSLFADLRFPKDRVYEDAAILYRLLDKANKVVLTGRRLYHYTVRTTSFTRSGFSEKRFDIIRNYKETYLFMKNKYPELCPLLTEGYYHSLKGMIADCTHEKQLPKKMHYIKRAGKEIRVIKRRMIEYKLLNKKQLLMTSILAWLPFAGFFYYKLRSFRGS